MKPHGWFAGLIAATLFTACTASTVGTDGSDDPTVALEAAMRTWGENGDDSYVWWTTDEACPSGLCKIVVVEGGEAIRVTLGSGSFVDPSWYDTPKTLPDWFTVVAEKLADGYDVDVTYHPTFGYPTEMRWDHVGWSDAAESITLTAALSTDAHAPEVPQTAFVEPFAYDMAYTISRPVGVPRPNGWDGTWSYEIRHHTVESCTFVPTDPLDESDPCAQRTGTQWSPLAFVAAFAAHEPPEHVTVRLDADTGRPRYISIDDPATADEEITVTVDHFEVVEP